MGYLEVFYRFWHIYKKIEILLYLCIDINKHLMCDNMEHTAESSSFLDEVRRTLNSALDEKVTDLQNYIKDLLETVIEAKIVEFRKNFYEDLDETFNDNKKEFDEHVEHILTSVDEKIKSEESLSEVSKKLILSNSIQKLEDVILKLKMKVSESSEKLMKAEISLDMEDHLNDQALAMIGGLQLFLGKYY